MQEKHKRVEKDVKLYITGFNSGFYNSIEINFNFLSFTTEHKLFMSSE